MIRINNLKKTFDSNVAVDIQSLSIKQGEVVGIVGNNGAGKTTLFRLILDLYKADTGVVLSKGDDVAKTEDWKWYTGAFIDSGFLIAFLTPEEYSYFIWKCHNLSKADVDNRLVDFEKFMAGEILGKKKYIHAFSMGNKQKIGIIGAMIIQPDILILDEPFNYLDPSSQIEMMRLITLYNGSYGTTMLLSSHNLEHITEVSSRIVLMEKGRVLEDMKDHSSNVISSLKEYFECQ